MSRYKRRSKGTLLIVSCKCSGKRERHRHRYSFRYSPSRPPSKFTKRRNGWITLCNELVLVWDQFETAFLEEVTCISRRLIWSITKSSLFRSLNVRTSLVQQKKFFKESVVIGLNYWFVHAFKLKIKPIARGTALISQSSERYFCTLISPN